MRKIKPPSSGDWPRAEHRRKRPLDRVPNFGEIFNLPTGCVDIISASSKLNFDFFQTHAPTRIGRFLMVTARGKYKTTISLLDALYPAPRPFATATAHRHSRHDCERSGVPAQ
jgi:hypothetical protein